MALVQVPVVLQVAIGSDPTKALEMRWPYGEQSAGTPNCRSQMSSSTLSGSETEWEDSSSAASEIPSSVEGSVWELAQHPSGSRQVQASLEDAASESERRAIAAELMGHVVKAARCPHANHVLQKCIATMEPSSLQFLVDEMLAHGGSLAQLAKHRYACRIVQQLLGKCEQKQVAEIMEILLANAKALSCHPFGGYTMQHAMRCGDSAQQYRLLRILERDAGLIGRSHGGCLVVATALACSEESDRVWLARAFVQDPALLVALADSRHGHILVVPLLQELPTMERKHAEMALSSMFQNLHMSKFGAAILEHLHSTGFLTHVAAK